MNCKILLYTEKKLKLFSLLNTSVALECEALMLVDTFVMKHISQLVRFRENKKKGDI